MTRARAALPVLLLLAAISAAACREEGEIKIASLRFEGVEQVNKGALTNALQTKKGSRFPWGRKRYFDRRAFEADIRRIEAFYRDRGFPDARVTVDTKLSEKQDEVDITVHVTEGEPIRIAAIDLEGFDVLTEREQRRVRRQLQLQLDQPLDRQLAAAARERALNVLRNNGYPYADVKLSNEPSGPRRERVIFRAIPGVLAHFGPVEVNGQASVDDYVIERQLSFRPGDPFSQEKMRESQRRLYGMELFQFVNVESLEDREQMPPEVPVRVTVGEGKHRKLTFGLGYGSEEHARGQVRWDHVNFFGGARHAGFEARWSSLDRGVRAQYREPYFFSPHLSLNLEGQAWHASEPVFSQDTLGARATIRHQTNTQNSWSVSLINEYQTSKIDPAALGDLPELRDELISLGLDPRGETRGTVRAVAFDVGRNTTNNLLDARRGYVLNGHLEQAGHWLFGSYDYWSATVEARHYVSVVRRFVVANRLSVGSIDPSGVGDANVPFHKRLFLGGSTSNRGWGRFEIAPLIDGFPIGGLSMLDGSAEVRVPLVGRLGAVAFVDYGNVWDEAWKYDVRDLRYSAGPGLRYQTPIGPARIDFGFQLNPIEGLLVNGEEQKRPFRVHFSIGQAF